MSPSRKIIALVPPSFFLAAPSVLFFTPKHNHQDLWHLPLGFEVSRIVSPRNRGVGLYLSFFFLDLPLFSTAQGRFPFQVNIVLREVSQDFPFGFSSLPSTSKQGILVPLPYLLVPRCPFPPCPPEADDHFSPLVFRMAFPPVPPPPTPGFVNQVFFYRFSFLGRSRNLPPCAVRNCQDILLPPLPRP